ncbi:hypothetical protein F7D01_10150 [Erythrobacter sp. 3-20A1M]|uniref:hypothetical protein n=1 Tax=Erythrobacter sp. 3-20A1M TaxID=2653850 RepID=UPI001BFC750F|nr:hypothetical protein [Erythrobacter sp. 3-20A1M]QWC57399.1 hypothetical protein F7D01_10150 [Erythrobacter sp. 3-20A1M]
MQQVSSSATISIADCVVAGSAKPVPAEGAQGESAVSPFAVQLNSAMSVAPGKVALLPITGDGESDALPGEAATGKEPEETGNILPVQIGNALPMPVDVAAVAQVVTATTGLVEAESGAAQHAGTIGLPSQTTPPSLPSALRQAPEAPVATLRQQPATLQTPRGAAVAIAPATPSQPQAVDALFQASGGAVPASAGTTSQPVPAAAVTPGSASAPVVEVAKLAPETGNTAPATPAAPTPERQATQSVKLAMAPVAIERGEAAPGGRADADAETAQENPTPGARLAQDHGEKAQATSARFTLASTASTAPTQQPGLSSAMGQTPMPLTPASGPMPHTDISQMIDRLMEARSAARSGEMQMAVSNADFGKVSVRLESGIAAGALSFSLSNADPDFAPAVQAALAQTGHSDRSITHGESVRADSNSLRHDGQPAGHNAHQGQTPPQSQTATDQQRSPAQGTRTRADQQHSGENAETPSDASTRARPRGRGIFA